LVAKYLASIDIQPGRCLLADNAKAEPVLTTLVTQYNTVYDWRQVANLQL